MALATDAAALSHGFIITLLLCFIVCRSSRGSTTTTTTTTIVAVQKRFVARSWCVANRLVGEKKLKLAIDYLCRYKPGDTVDCSGIQPGGPCYEPNSVRDHASVVLNLYYKAHNATKKSCPPEVGGFTVTDPSTGTCKYP